MNPPKRLLSLDALRGFDMFFIMGGAAFVRSFQKIWPNGFTDALAAQMQHMEWEGFAFYDMIFPLFLFIAGISFPFSYAKNLSVGMSRRAIYAKVAKRALILIVLGIVYNGFFELKWETMRFYSVLGRIGLAWGLAAVIYMNANFKWRVVWSAGLLLGYWALLALCTAPDAPGASPFSFEGNIASYVDRVLLPGRLNEGTVDALGLLSTIPAVVTALLGMFVGDLVFGASDSAKMKRMTGIIALLGVALIAVGLLWDPAFPINKKLWSSSYVCFAGGLSMLLFALFYYIVDILEWRRWTFFFTVIGLNSITIYMVQRFFNLRYTAKFFGDGISKLMPENVQPLVISIFYIAVCWVILYFLYRKKIFLKV